MFLAYATYDFFIVIGYFMVILNYGKQANQTDFEIKELLVELSKDCNETKQLCDDGRLWSKKNRKDSDDPSEFIKSGNIYILEKTDKGWRNNNDEMFENLDDFININDKVEHQVGDLLGSIESAISRIDYKIENH